MKDIDIGRIAISLAGHDLGKYYVIFLIEAEYVYLVNGKNRTISNPKKKKIKHVCIINEIDKILIDKVINKTVTNEEIKRNIKLLNRVDFS